MLVLNADIVGKNMHKPSGKLDKYVINSQINAQTVADACTHNL